MSIHDKVPRLHALPGNYPNIAALKKGAIHPSGFEFDFATEETVDHAFKRVVRELEFDVAELAIATYLQAQAHGKPPHTAACACDQSRSASQSGIHVSSLLFFRPLHLTDDHSSAGTSVDNPNVVP